MNSNVLNIVGLILDIVGVILIFYNAINIDTTKHGTAEEMQRLIYNDSTKENVHDCFAKIGLVIVILGFVFQIASNLV